MNYNFDLSNPFAEPAPFNLEAIQGVPQQQQGAGMVDALRALGLNAGGEGDQTELLRSMIQQWAQQMEAQRAADAEALAQTPRPQEFAEARRYGKDPYRAAISDVEAQRARGGTPSIDAFKAMNRIPELSPEEILASQGNTAMNQWMSLRGQQGGGGGGAGINPEELRRLNTARAASSYFAPQGRYV